MPAATPPSEIREIPEFAYRARNTLTVVGGRLHLLRRDAARGRADPRRCVGRLDDIEASVRRLEALIDGLERGAAAEGGR